MSADLPPPLALDAATAAEYVIGYPVHVWVVVRLLRDGIEIYDLPNLTPFALEGLGLTLARPETGDILWRARPGPLDPREPYDRFHLRRRESRRMLADLSPLLPKALEPGTWWLTLTYHGAGYEVVAARTAITFRAPSPAEAEQLERLQPELRRSRSWGAWSLLAPAAPLAREVAKEDPLRYNRVLRALTYGREPLSKDDLAMLGALDDFYGPETEALRAEVLFVSGDRAGFHRAAAELVERHPDYAWRAERIAAGSSLIGWHRRQWDER